MSRSTPRTEHARPQGGTRALTAADGAPPGRPCVEGELVWASDLCDDRPCRCEWGWNGAATEGVTTIARVRRLPGVGRSAIRGLLADRIRTDGGSPAAARARADRLLDLAAALPEGTLLRLEQGVPVAFPPGSRVRGRGRVVVPAPGGGR